MFSKIKKWFLTKFGDLKYYKYPFWLVYCPTSFEVKGRNYLELMMYILPGDILIRGYSDYVDGLFIPGDYSHAGIYVGSNQVIHAISEGVCYINLIDYMRCDRILVMRPKNKSVVTDAINFSKNVLNKNCQYDFDFKENNNAYYCFELVAKSYKSLKINKQKVKKFLGLYNKDLYIADSFINCKDLKRIYEYNPKRKVKYINYFTS